MMIQTPMTMTTPSKYEDAVENAHLIANENCDLILESLGFKVGYYGKIQCACPVHGGDNRHGFSWHPQKKVWKCWTNHCHEKYGSNLIGLIRAIRNCSLDAAIEYIYSVCDNEIDLSSLKRKNFIESKLPKAVENKIFDKTLLNNMDHNVPYFNSRKIPMETCKKFSCFLCKKDGHPLKDRACVSLFDDQNNLVGFVGRLIDDSKISSYNPKWKVYPENLAKNNILFNLNNSLLSLQKEKTAILVEGPLDAMIWDSYGIPNVLAILGNYLSEKQISILLKNKVRKLIFALDPDAGGTKGLESSVEKAKMYFDIEHLILTKDPSDYTKEEAWELFND